MKPEPSYNLDQAMRLVAEGDYLLTKKVANWLLNHGFVPTETVEGVFESLAPGGFSHLICVQAQMQTFITSNSTASSGT